MFGTENSDEYSTDIGYPKKIWITNDTKLNDILSKCFQINMDEFELDSCLSKGKTIANDDNIYDKFVHTNGNINELLIMIKTRHKEDRHSNKNKVFYTWNKNDNDRDI